MTTSPRLLVVQHEEEAPPLWLGEWWAERGIVVDVLRADLGRPVPDRVEHDGLVVLGGYMGAGDDELHPWLTDTKALIRTAVENDTPVLGVCLGHQLMALALGGEVARNPAGKALGLQPVALTDAGRMDPLLAGSDGARAIHYNQDIVTVPPDDAVVLATAPDWSVAALRFADRAWGVQFHPETSPEVFALWTRNEAGSMAGVSTAALAEVAAAEDELRWAWRPLAERFAAVVSS